MAALGAPSRDNGVRAGRNPHVARLASRRRYDAGNHDVHAEHLACRRPRSPPGARADEDCTCKKDEPERSCLHDARLLWDVAMSDSTLSPASGNPALNQSTVLAITSGAASIPRCPAPGRSWNGAHTAWAESASGRIG